jgi:hypothetical protein
VFAVVPTTSAMSFGGNPALFRIAIWCIWESSLGGIPFTKSIARSRTVISSKLNFRCRSIAVLSAFKTKTKHRGLTNGPKCHYEKYSISKTS